MKIEAMTTNIALLENVMKETAERHVIVETAIARILEHIQRQDVLNQTTRTTITGLGQEVQKHQEYFQEVVRVLQNHEQHIANHGVARQEMAQYINTLIEENEKKRQWLTVLMKESQAQTKVLRQHHMGKQVLAEVIKQIDGGPATATFSSFTTSRHSNRTNGDGG